MIKKYRSKIIIEAIKFTGNVSEIEAFKKNRPYDNTETSEYKDEIRIQDSSGIGTFIVHIGDYVIKAPNGTICTCPSDFFEKEFEEVKSSEDTENKQDEQVIKEDKDNHDYKEAKEENQKLYEENQKLKNKLNNAENMIKILIEYIAKNYCEDK